MFPARFRSIATVAGLVLCAFSCGKSAPPARPESTPVAQRPTPADSRGLLPPKEEVSGVIGFPVVSMITSEPARAVYRTANPFIEVTVEAQRSPDAASAAQAMQAARAAAAGAAGKPPETAGLGDDSFYGASSVLRLRQGSVIFVISPPNLAQAAQMQAYQQTTAESMQEKTPNKETKNFDETMKDDPRLSPKSETDPMKAAADVLASPSPRASDFDARARAMARALGEKALARLKAAAPEK
jgi:hypothetical protein